jgi:hypothetical protein
VDLAVFLTFAGLTSFPDRRRRSSRRHARGRAGERARAVRGRPDRPGGAPVNVPIALTLVRIVLVPLLMVFLISSERVNVLIAAVIFVAASLTDWLDGVMARRMNQVTKLGTLLDPVADKLLVAAALVSLVHVDRVDVWVAVVIIIASSPRHRSPRGGAVDGGAVPASTSASGRQVQRRAHPADRRARCRASCSRSSTARARSRRAALAVTVLSAQYFYGFFLRPSGARQGEGRWPRSSSASSGVPDRRYPDRGGQPPAGRHPPPRQR